MKGYTMYVCMISRPMERFEKGMFDVIFQFLDGEDDIHIFLYIEIHVCALLLL